MNGALVAASCPILTAPAPADWFRVRKFYTGLRRKGRVHDQAVCAVANKLAGRAYALMKRMSQGQDARYVYRDLQGRPIAKEEARCRVQNEFP